MTGDEQPTTRIIRVRYSGVCAICGVELAVGSNAMWNKASHTLTCLACAETPASTTSMAGRSAEREATRRHAAYQARAARRSVLQRWLGPKVHDRSLSWKRGAEGERLLGARLDELRSEGMIVRHDLRVPGTRASNIDHIVIARSGVHIIDAKRYDGRIEPRRRRGESRLFVGSRDRTNLVDKLAVQILAVERATRTLALPTPITPCLCFVDGDWPMFSRGFEVNGVHVVWRRKLFKLLRRPGNLTDAQMSHTGQLIFDNLPLA